MPTEWTYPTVVTQFCEADAHIPWLGTDADFDELNFIRTTKDLLHIPNPLVNDLKMKTYYLVLKGFNFDTIPNPISGVEVYVNVRRTGRITDETVKLWNGESLGDNRANAEMIDLKTYGTSTDLWGMEQISTSTVSTSTFGIVLRYQSHPTIPHRTTPNLEHVQIRLW